MSKYNELLIENKELIERIKELNEKLDEISIRLNEAYESSMNGAPVDCETIQNEMDDIQIALYQANESLTQTVEEAYWDVPFSKPRQQGIAKFWELSGIG